MGVLYAGDYIEANSDGEEKDVSFFMAYNMHWIPHDFALPKLPEGSEWRIAIDTGKEGVEGIYKEGEEPRLDNQRTVTLPERTILVLRAAAAEKAPEKTTGKAVKKAEK